MTATATQTNVTKVKSLLSRLEDPMFNFQVLFGATLILLIGGVTRVISASSVFSFETYGNSRALAERQFIFAIFGVFCMWRVSFWSPRATRKWCVLLLVGSIGALVLVLLIGTSINGQRNWLEFGPLRL